MKTICPAVPLTKKKVQLNGKFVHRYNIITTPHWVYTVYEPDNRDHTSLFYEGDQRLGKISSRKLPPEIDALPVGPTRWDAIKVWRDQLDEQIGALINLAFPETAGIRCKDGEIELTVAQ